MNVWDILLAALAGILAGAAGSVGIGGGGILLLFLTAFINTPQLKAQGINLIFFLPCAALALIFHHKQHMVEWKVTLFCLLGGLAGVCGGIFLSGIIGGDMLRKIFGVMLLVLGTYEIFGLFKKTST